MGKKRCFAHAGTPGGIGGTLSSTLEDAGQPGKGKDIPPARFETRRKGRRGPKTSPRS